MKIKVYIEESLKHQTYSIYYNYIPKSFNGSKVSYIGDINSDAEDLTLGKMNGKVSASEIKQYMINKQ